jgi:Tfp pilus assembly protein PilF
MLRGYAAGKSTEAVLRDVVRVTPRQLDDQFQAYVRARLANAATAKSAKDAMDYPGLIARGTIESLEQAMYISPYDVAAHTRLAELYQRAGNKAGVVRERQAIVALQPVDMAEARYQLAAAHLNNGDRASARREVLKALEVAPNFERAQELLLQLSEEQQ